VKFFLKTLVTSLIFISVLNRAIYSTEKSSREGLNTPGYALDEAFHYFFNKDYDKAIQFFEKHISIYGPNEVSYRYLAQIYFFKQNYKKAKEILEKSIKLNSGSIPTLSLLADVYLTQNNIEGAIKAHENILELDLFNEESLIRLANIYTQKENERKAAAYYKRLVIAVKKNSYNRQLLYQAYINLGNFYYNQGDYKKAIFYYEKLQDLELNDINSLFVLSELYKMNGNFSKSIEAINELLNLYPEHKSAIESVAESHYILGTVEARSQIMRYFSTHKNRIDLFLGMLYELNNDDEKAEMHFRKAASENQSRLSIYIGLYKLYMKANNLKEAKKAGYTAALLCQRINAFATAKTYINNVLKILEIEADELNFHKEFFREKPPTPFVFHEHIQSIAQDFVETYITFGSISENNANENRATAAYYSQAIFYLNQLDLWYNWQKNFLENQKDNEKNTAVKEKLVELDELIKAAREKKYNTLLNLGWALNQPPIKNPKDALHKINMAKNILPSQPHAYFFAGIVEYDIFEKSKKKNLTKNLYTAEENIINAIKLTEQQTGKDKVPPGYFFYLGIIQDKKGDFNSAEANLKEAINKDSYNSVYLNYLGYLYSLKAQKLEEARNLLIRALEDDPENEAYLDSLGWIFYKMNKYKEALEQLLLAANEADKKEKKDPVIHFHIAETYYKINNFHQALFYYNKTLELFEFSSEPLDKEYIEKQISKLSEKK